jgi:hypothetical protein
LHLSIGTHWHLACRVSERFKAPFHGTCMSLWEFSGAAFWSGAWLQIAV